MTFDLGNWFPFTDDANARSDETGDNARTSAMLKSNHGFISTPLKWESYVASLHLNPTSPKLSSAKYLSLMSPRMQCHQLFCLKYN